MGLAWSLRGRGKDTVPWEHGQLASLSWEALKLGGVQCAGQFLWLPQAGNTELCSDLRLNVPTRPQSHAIEVGMEEAEPHSRELTVGCISKRPRVKSSCPMHFQQSYCVQQRWTPTVNLPGLEDEAVHFPELWSVNLGGLRLLWWGG